MVQSRTANLVVADDMSPHIAQAIKATPWPGRIPERSRVAGIKMWTTAATTALFVGIGLVALAAYGSSRWADRTRALRSRLSPATGTSRTQTVDFHELRELPAPVQRFLRKVLVEGAPLVTAVRVRHEGEFNMSEAGDQWRPFSSDQLVTIRPPGFDWDARIRIIPGVTVRVHDAYVDGDGILHAALLGLFPVVKVQGKGEIAEGELMRFLAEAAWYPTALLPSQGVRWTEVDAHAARAELTDGEVLVKLTFHFSDQDLIESVEAESRGRMAGKQIVPTRWGGRFWDYEQRGGMLVPLRGEVAWLLPSGAKPYWRGRISSLEYQFAKKE